MYNNRRKNDFRRDNRYENRDDNYSRDNFKPKRYSKTMIFLKSMVFMLFIVLVTLVAALFIVKSKKMHFGYDQKVECKKQEAIKIKGNIVNIIGDKMSVLILTQADRNGKQELIKIDSRCGNEELRVLLQKVE